MVLSPRMKNKAFLILAFVLGIAGSVRSDDVGIVEVRFIEEAINIYVLEVDIPPTLLNTINLPILPKHWAFIGNPEKIMVGSKMVVRFRFTSGAEPPTDQDEILLYWQRTGVVLTSYWLDGNSKRLFINRDLTGIRVKVADLHDVVITNVALAKRSIAAAINEVSQYFMLYLLLIIACVSLSSQYSIKNMILALVFGHGISLLATDLGIPPIFPEGFHLLLGLTALLFLLSALGNTKTSAQLWPLLLVIGVMQGLNFSGPDFGQTVSLSREHQVLAHFTYNSFFDIIFALAVPVLAYGVNRFNKASSLQKWQKPILYLMGGLVVTQMLFALPELLRSNEPLAQKELPQFSPNSTVNPNNRAVSKKVELQYPLMGYVTLTPFEIRCEWLIRAKDLNLETRRTAEGENIIPIANQAALKDDILNRLLQQTKMTVDNTIAAPAYTNVHFVSVATYGVTIKQNPTTELLEDAVLGLTLAYSVDEAPEAVKLELLGDVARNYTVPIAFTDPWGTELRTLSKDNTNANWKRRMAGFRRPVIKAVNISTINWSPISITLIVLALIIYLFVNNGPLAVHKNKLIVVTILLAIITYPFFRSSIPNALAKQAVSNTASIEALGNLLTNIYRAFDYRTEEAIYDKLAISATGDQLAEIYLEHRSSMELEERGGARANVDDVEILKTNSIEPNDEGFTINAIWTISGSVNHYGHIHYRKNRYNAIVNIIESNGIWKINNIDMIEETRLL